MMSKLNHYQWQQFHKVNQKCGSRTIRKTAEVLTRFRAVMLHIIIILREHMYHSFTGNRFTKHERENEIHAKQQSRISGIMGCSVLFNVTVD